MNRVSEFLYVLWTKGWDNLENKKVLLMALPMEKKAGTGVLLSVGDAGVE